MRPACNGTTMGQDASWGMPIRALSARPEALEGGESLHPTPKTPSQKNARKIKSEKAGKEHGSAAAAGTFIKKPAAQQCSCSQTPFLCTHLYCLSCFAFWSSHAPSSRPCTRALRRNIGCAAAYKPGAIVASQIYCVTPTTVHRR